MPEQRGGRDDCPGIMNARLVVGSGNPATKDHPLSGYCSYYHEFRFGLRGGGARLHR